MQKLDNIGTLFIQNIEYLSLETQNYLAEFISCGFFRKFRSEHRIFSNVRIICSTNKDLIELVSNETFSKALYNELNKTIVLMPPVNTLSDIEVKELMDGFAQQTKQTILIGISLVLMKKISFALWMIGL